MTESNTLAHIEKIHSTRKGIENKIYKDEKSNRYIGLESGHLQKIPKIEGEVTGDLKKSLINGIAQYTRDDIINSIDRVKISLNDTTADYLLTKLVAGTNITLTENNDSVNETLTISDTTTVGHVIREEGVNLTQRANLNFIGTAITATDNAGTNSTDITVVIPADFITSISDTDSINLTVAAGALTADVLPAGIDHGALADLLTDDHTQYALLAGRVGGQTFISGTGVNDPLRLRSTSGIGASGADIIFQVGNNGATESMRMLNNGTSVIGGTTQVSANINTLLTLRKNVNASVSQLISNGTAGTAAYAYMDARNDLLKTMQFGCSSSGTAAYGALGANEGFFYTNGGGFTMMVESTNGIIKFATGGTAERARFDKDGKFGVGVTPTALIHMKAGTATANTAPLKFTSGTNLTTAENGAMEYNGTNLFFTRAGAVREGVITQSAVSVVSPTVPNRTITVNIDGTTYYISAKTTND